MCEAQRLVKRYDSSIKKILKSMVVAIESPQCRLVRHPDKHGFPQAALYVLYPFQKNPALTGFEPVRREKRPAGSLLWEERLPSLAQTVQVRNERWRRTRT